MVVQGNVLLSTEPPCVDFLLLRRQGGTGVAAALTDGPRILRRLWPTLPRATLMEYRSPLNPYRRGDLDRLWGYLHIYFANQHAKSGEGAGAPGKRAVAPSDPPDVCARGDVAAVLVVARRPAALDEDVAAMGLSWEGFGPGYWRVRGGLFALYVVELDVAGPAEDHHLLSSVGSGAPLSPRARAFWTEILCSEELRRRMQEMEGYDELVLRFLSTLTPEQRLAGVPPEARLAGLGRDEQALALPIEVLPFLPEEYLRSLRSEVQAELRRRLEQKGS
jgi:hypothetical protein